MESAKKLVLYQVYFTKGATTNHFNDLEVVFAYNRVLRRIFNLKMFILATTYTSLTLQNPLACTVSFVALRELVFCF